MKKMKNLKIVCSGFILILFVIGGFVSYMKFSENKNNQKEQESGIVNLTQEQINQIDNQLKENSCEIIGMFYPLVERNLNFQNFDTRIIAIRNYISHKNMSGKIEYNEQNVIFKDLGDPASSNALFHIDFLKEYYQKIFKEELDEKQLKKENIWDDIYYDTGAIPCGGCLTYIPVLNKIEYDKQTNTYTMTIVDVSLLEETYKNSKILEDTEIDSKNIGNKLGYLKISFQWKDNQIILISSKSNPLNTYE